MILRVTIFGLLLGFACSCFAETPQEIYVKACHLVQEGNELQSKGEGAKATVKWSFALLDLKGLKEKGVQIRGLNEAIGKLETQTKAG